MKERPILFNGEMVRAILEGRKTQTRRVIKPKLSQVLDEYGVVFGDCDVRLACPLGRPGDTLWVREKFADTKGMGFDHRFHYGADTLPGSEGDQVRKEYGVKWKPSIHMPRELSRINLEITNVRVERLQDIKEADAKAEGVHQSVYMGTHRMGFGELWDSIYAYTEHNWALNPWVWAVEFKQI